MSDSDHIEKNGTKFADVVKTNDHNNANNNGTHDETTKEKVNTRQSLGIEMADDLKTRKQRGILCCGKSSEDEPQIPEPVKVGFFKLFRFADKLDVLLMVVGSVCMMSLGIAVPMNIFFFGELLTKFVVFDTRFSNNTMSMMSPASNLTECQASRITKAAEGDESLTAEKLLELILSRYVVAFVAIGFLAFAVAYIGMTFWTLTGVRQIRRVRRAFFEAVMKQSVGWFDINNAGELNSRLVEDMDRLNDGFGDKMATFVQWFSTFIGGYILGFVVGWKLTLVVMAGCPLLVLVAASMGRFIRTLVKRELLAYAKAGAVAEETFSSIRTVAAFGGEKKAESRFSDNLQHALKEGVRKATVGGLTGGLFWLIIFCIFGLALWYGAKLTREECLDPGAVLQVFFGVLIASMSLGHAAPLLENFSNARAAAASLFSTIDAHVDIDSSSEEGYKPKSLDGTVQFVDVGFFYPARPEVQVLKGLNLSVKKGETVALVGESGCGKSTTIQLVQRFYECAQGKVLIDGKDLKDYNLACLRNFMGIVSQEPVLFATTIGENIRLGAKRGEEVTQEQIETAAKQSNCYDFITKLPKGFDTQVGERGVQLSGGQKQRIAIARALVRNPAILLLDEATSALDTQSEAVVQDALDKASEGRTTIVIAHRLSTVKGANKIFAFKDGQVYEQGTHDELMSMQGIYYSLVTRQLQREKEEDEERRRDTEASKTGSSLNMSKSPMLSPSHSSIANRSSSLRRSKRMGSIRSLKEITADGYILGMDQSEAFDGLDELELEDGVVVAKRLASVEDQTEANQLSVFEILKMNRPEWYLIAIGTLSSVVTGSVQLVFALLMSEIIGTLSEPDPEIQKQKVDTFVGYIILTGFGSALATLLQNGAFALSGERLTMRLRKESFAAVIRQEISYFDREENGVGVLTSRLASDASQVKGATGIRIGVLTQSFTTIVGALIISFVYVWELTLVVMIFMPIMILSGKIQHRLLSGHNKADKQGIEQGGKMAQEAISNMRTVTSLNKQKYFTQKFNDHFKLMLKTDSRKSFIYGIAFALSQCMVFFMYAICFGFGGYLVVCDCLPWRTERIPFFHILRIFAAVTFGSMAVGRSSSQLPDYTKAKIAAYQVKKLLKRQSAIDPTSTTGTKPTKVEGKVEFSGVEFSYPTRREVQVLQGLNFDVKKGETLALVGSSGCGKSTTVSLLERFYDAAAGQVMMDGKDVTSLNIQWLRQRLGIVSQEPTLFDATIAENIAYGDNTRDVSMTEIIDASTKANAHRFISDLPKGYETNVGAKGTQLSGGQKQRIAIARALVRNPAILLLDEATSALDTESEKIVQEALDKALKGRTAIIIAHRLSTIRNADKIGVIDNGKIVEMGTHQQLLDKKEYYFNLINAQL